MIIEIVLDIKYRILGIIVSEYICIIVRLDGDKLVFYIMGECINYECLIYGMLIDVIRYRMEIVWVLYCSIK